MGLKDSAKEIADYIKSKKHLLDHNHQLFNIYEGSLLDYIRTDMMKQFSPQAFEQAEKRIAPINILKRMNSKLSKIYSKPPKRTLIGGDEADQELFNWYLEKLDVDTCFSLANSFFNLFKNTSIEPFLDEGEPNLRIIPSDRFLVRSTNKMNQMRMTEFIKSVGSYYDEGEIKNIYLVYDDLEFMYIDQDGKILALTEDNENTYGKIPIVYINRSRHELIPQADTDTLKMTKLIPILLSDLNYAIMFQCFSIIYGIDVDDKGLKMAPNAFWHLKSDPNSDKSPQVGTITPSVDSNKALDLIKAQLSMWFQSKNIKPGSVGELTTENMASGIAKAVDEMDTSEDRKEQIPYFKKAEMDFWNLLMYTVHPQWIKDKSFEQRRPFSQGLKVMVEFAEQRAEVDESKVIDDQIKLIGSGLTTRKNAIRKLNPDLSEEQVDLFLKDIDLERTTYLSNNNDQEDEDVKDLEANN